MVIGKMRRIFNRSLSIAMAASIMATSVPQLSVTAMAQEVGMNVQENTTEQDSAEVAEPDETEGGKNQDEDFEDVNSKDDDSSQDNSAGGSPADENAGNEAEEGTNDLDETEGEDVNAPDEDSKTEDDSTDQEDDSDVKADDEKDKKEDKPSVVKKARKVYAAASSDAEEDVEGKIIYENNFDSASVGDKSDDSDETGIVVELAGNNKAMEYDVALKGDNSWEEAFMTSYALDKPYETPVKEKMTMSYDIYFPNSTVDGDEDVEAVEEGSISDFGTMKVQTVLNNGDDWEWLVADEDFAITAQDLVLSDIEGYSKIHISVDITGKRDSENESWEIEELTSLRAVSLKVVGAPSTYDGRLYIDNVVLKDTSSDSGSEEPEEPAVEEDIYTNNFNDVEKLEEVVNMSGSEFGDVSKDGDGKALVEIAQLADGNKAIKITADLSETSVWADIFKMEIDLKEEYAKTISDKVVMSYDLYFPENSIGEDFGTMTAMGGLKSGDSWTWITEKQGSNCTTAKWDENSDVEGYKVFHVEINMNNFKTWNNAEGKDEDFPFADITPIKAVIPCLAGNTSTYKGDIYLDNLKVKAVGVTDGDDNPDDPGKEDPIEGELIYKNNFDSLESLEGVLTENAEGATPEIATLANGNKAVKYSVKLSGKEWEDIFKAEFKVSPSYDKTISDKVVMSYDIYFPKDSAGENFDSMKAQAALKCGANWKWVSQKSWPEFKTTDLKEDANVPGYQKIHVQIDMSDFAYNGEDYPFENITPIQAVIPCFAGSGSTYEGDLYLDNLEVIAVSKSEEEDPPAASKELIYENNFNSLSDITGVLSENVSGANPTLAELATDNKAVKYSVKLSGSGWDDIFKAQFNLTTPYTKKIAEKVVMSYDVYFPADKVGTGFDSMKAQAALSCGNWTWATAKSIPEFTTTKLVEDDSVPGYKKVHVEIDMTDFETYDNDLKANKPYPFEDITPIQAVIPCFAGSGSTYEGDLYLDNLEVWAVNESGSDIPEPTEDLFLNLDTSNWEVSANSYQYTGESKIKNETVGDKMFLVASMDYSADTSHDWSEAKFEYTHPETVDTLQGYNAFKADVYYKPADKKTGSFGIQLYASIPDIKCDAALPAGEPANISGLEGYYKAEFVLNNRFPAGAFTNLTFGFVGKNTDFVGDVYLDNMRFTKVTVEDAEDVYVDSTILPVKGPGIQVADDGRSIQTASGKQFAIAEEVEMVDAGATMATQKLYAYLKAVGESDSVIFGHQNDTHHKAGSKGDGFTNSDTKDLTGSIAGVVGIDTLSLTGNEASTWDTSEAERIAKVAEITREAAAEGAIITLSAHMPNFELIDQRVKKYEASGKTGNTNETLGYWEVNGEKQYNFSGYTPGTTSGNIVPRIMPGQDLNYLYTDYLDLIADYAKAVEEYDITILFRPLHENTGSWFWWGAAFCDEQAYINLYRYTVDYLKETKGVHNIIYVYGPGSEAANVSEYSARYPGDAYVDMIGYDLYHQNPSQENEAGYLQSIKKQNTILRDFAKAHNKLYAITETGVADKDAAGKEIALQRTGNTVMDWYMQLLDEISNDGVSYFLVWANFGENGSFYLPYAVEKKEDGYLHGHEMMDEFIRFYNDGRSVFATDMNSGFKNVSGVTNTTKENDVSGYFIAPQSGDRILPDENNPKTRIAAKVSGVDSKAEDLSVQFVVSTEFDEVILKAAYNEEEAVWEAELKDSALVSMGEAMGTITLLVNNEKISEISARFNMVEAEQDDMVPEDFEGYNGNSQQLGLTWATNKASGSEITLSLTNDSEKVFGGDYGLQMDITLAASDAWAGATKSFNADWSDGNALEFYTIPETNGQKIVVQVTAGNQVFEVYLQEFDSYTTNAADGFPVKVTIPFSAFVGRDNKNAKLDPSKIESIGLWCNAIAKEGVEFPLSTTLYYDEFKVVTTNETTVDFAPTAYKGIWFKEIPDQTYTGKAIKPDVQVYDDAKLLTPKKDYTVSYKNNTKAGRADVIIKGKGNYSETITGHFTILPKTIGELTITAPEYIIYNGREQNIAVTVKDGKKKLGTKNDYTQVITFDDGSGQTAEVQKAKEEGTYKIKITMKGNYAGDVELTCKVVKDKDLLSKATVTIPNSLDYDDGKEVKFEESQIVVKLKGKVIPQTEEDEDGTVNNYVVSYDNNKQVGTASVVITAGTDSKYVGSVRKTFTIKGKAFSTNTIEITGFETKLPYTGKAIYQNPVLKDKTSESEEPLEKNVDYRIAYVKQHVNAGTVTMTITGLGKYSGTIKKNFTIDKVALTENMLQGKTITVKQNRAGATPDVELVYEGRTLIKDRDYKLTYTGNKNTTSETKKAWINIAGIGNFKGSLRNAVELKIEPKSWDSGEITVEVPDMKYSSSKARYTPNPVVYDNGKKLTKNKDYTVAYASNTKEDIGEITDEWQSHEAKVIITLSGSDYVVGEEAGEAKEFEFRITGKMISEAKVKIKPEKKQFFSQYGTELEKDDLIVTYKNEPVGDDEYDIVDYSKNDKKGKATLVLAGKGQYGGTKKVTFTINARGMETNLAEEFKNVVAEITALMMEALD
ncbi:MAG: hypothetical protein HDR09_20580 [Lachnospiraceae bacterium]|nr:hypothetical protein [Lachnospiraceae bacterium]MBD5506071.1 hypothetical protein [Lachnospiraceae bacterium]